MVKPTGPVDRFWLRLVVAAHRWVRLVGVRIIRGNWVRFVGDARPSVGLFGRSSHPSGKLGSFGRGCPSVGLFGRSPRQPGKLGLFGRSPHPSGELGSFGRGCPSVGLFGAFGAWLPGSLRHVRMNCQRSHRDDRVWECWRLANPWSINKRSSFSDVSPPARRLLPASRAFPEWKEL
jgi:hypothetical protein